jgi:3-oxoacyl-ACP reductase-like protein
LKVSYNFYKEAIKMDEYDKAYNDELQFREQMMQLMRQEAERQMNDANKEMERRIRELEEDIARQQQEQGQEQVIVDEVNTGSQSYSNNSGGDISASVDPASSSLGSVDSAIDTGIEATSAETTTVGTIGGVEAAGAAAGAEGVAEAAIIIVL